VSEVSASHREQRVTVAYDEAQVTPEAIAAKINGLGYHVS
jgi:copper chaperone CopZ